MESITELIKSKKSSKKVASLIELAEKYEDIQLDTSEMLYHKAYLTAKALNDNQLIIDCIKGYSFIKNLQGKFEEGLALSKESLSLAQQIDDPLLIARQFANLGNSYSYLARFDEAIDLYQKSLDVFMKLKDRQKMAQISNVIASTYNNMATSNKFDTIWTVKSLSYRLKALEYSSAIEDSLLICDILVGTSLGYCNAQKFEIAIRYASMALPIALKKGYTNFEAQIYNIFSMAYRGIGDRQKSLDNGLKSVKVFKQLKHVQGLVIALKELTLIYKDLGLYNKADESVNQAIRIAEENQMKYILDGLYLNKSELSGTMSNYKLAYEFYDKGIQLKDSLRGIEVTKTISELEKKYETAKKDKEIIELSNKQKINKWVIISLLTLIGFVSLFSWFIIKNWQFRAKIAEQEKEQIKKEHKIEATSSIIKGQEEERTRMARDLHDGLGGILSGLKYSLNNMEENIILNGENVTQFHQAIEQIDHAITEMRR
ncbi:MAG TPA: tetratricopeptide repeat protein, partial [Saprospiraceae bacterium]|nr:tetratricopeptide repeat protein [Saprospiraceae bacterium]